MKALDLLNTPLTGINLIEASAGTGKTYTIAGLFVRLILEQKFTPDQILVVTFTKAATEELKDRIRKKLIAARDGFSRGASDDDLIDALAKNHDDPALAGQLLQGALIDFDKAAIFTIHGFCQRVLHENAFETGSLFDTELVADPVKLIQEVADDFWRKNIYHSPPEFISYATKKMPGPESFAKLLGRMRTPDVTIVPDLTKPALDHLDDFRDCFKNLRKAWRRSRDAVVELLKSPSLSGTVYGSLKEDKTRPPYSKRDLKVGAMADAMDRFVDPRSTGFPLFQDLEKFRTTKIHQSTRKNQIPPSHEIFNLCEALCATGAALQSEMEAYLLFLKSELFRFAVSELSARKRAGNIKFFDDLLTTVAQALGEEGGNALAAAIRQKYQAALVDEFQDTDSVQYEIFSRLFGRQESGLFMIGDPKQAIYSFRGADVFSYMKAARRADRKFTLSKNWRSAPGLIKAVNTLFSGVKRPFVFEEITFEDVAPGGHGEPVSEKGRAALKLWYLASEDSASRGKPVNKTDAIQRIAAAVAGEIARMLSDRAPDPPDNLPGGVRAGDIAVLVRTNRQAQVIKTCLSARNIPSVLYNAGNIFDSQEAAEMERILAGVAEPSNERLFRSALVTNILGVAGEEMDSESKAPGWWEDRLANFREYYQVWIRYGFIQMFRVLLTREKVRERLLALPDGERRLTNVLHLSEILHREGIERQLGLRGLLKWLAEQRDPATPRREEHQLRLESDENALKIVTIHKSKGLEYPVVFCPFAWEGSTLRGDEIVFHDADDDQALKLDLGSEKRAIHAAWAQKELLAENMRLLYVAVTRAKRCCYLVWGRINTAETSAMAYLFHHEDMAVDDDIVAHLKDTFALKNDAELLADLKRLVTASEGNIALGPLPAEEDGDIDVGKPPQEALVCRKFNGRIDTTWKISSYSSLASRRTPSAELPDHDAYYPPSGSLAEPTGKLNIFSFPKGTRAGTFFHDVWEHLDFVSAGRPDAEDLVVTKLKEYGFEPTWKETVCGMVQKVVSVPFFGPLNASKLASIPCQERINEMEFYFPLKPLRPATLQRIFTQNEGVAPLSGFPERLESLTFSPAQGFMKGYIDLIFHHEGSYYVVDWKSNFLGDRLEAYHQDSLNRVMQDDLYVLQYHIYTLALHQYLRTHIQGYQYKKHFGGVFYIFIRGVDPDHGPEFGIYRDRPSWNLIDALGRSLIPGFSG